jgi:putative endonuclease
MRKIYCIYILASRSRSLYTGVTNNLERRMIEHRNGLIPGFTSQYRNFRLVHFEAFANIRDAIAREKEIKGWRREKKVNLIQQRNPTWEDLAAQLPHHFASFQFQKQIPPGLPNTGNPVRDDKSHGHAGATTDARATTDAKSPMSFRTK